MARRGKTGRGTPYRSSSTLPGKERGRQAGPLQNLARQFSRRRKGIRWHRKNYVSAWLSGSIRAGGDALRIGGVSRY